MNKRNTEIKDFQVPRCVHTLYMFETEAISMLMFNRCLHIVCAQHLGQSIPYTPHLNVTLPTSKEWNALLTRA